MDGAQYPGRSKVSSCMTPPSCWANCCPSRTQNAMSHKVWLHQQLQICEFVCVDGQEAEGALLLASQAADNLNGQLRMWIPLSAKILDNAQAVQLSAALERVRAGADIMPQRQLHKQLTDQLGTDWRSKLASFEDEPLAAASIGQVQLPKHP